MGCSASKVDLDAYLVTQTSDSVLLDGLVTAKRVEVTCGGGFVVAGGGFEPHPKKTPMKIKFDGEARATVEKSNAGAFAVVKEPGNTPCYSFIVKDANGKLAAVCKKGAPRTKKIDTGGISLASVAFQGDMEQYSTIYCVKPRHEGQPSTFDADGTAMYAWARIRPKVPSQADRNMDSTLTSWPQKRLGIYPVAADGTGYAQAAELVLCYARNGSWRATTDYETTYDTAEGLAVIPHYSKLSVAGGVDPLLAVFALLEYSAWEHEGPGLNGFS